MQYHDDPTFAALTRDDLLDCMRQLGLDPGNEGDCRRLARNLLMGKGGMARVQDWIDGRREITGPASAAIRLWMAIEGVAPPPRFDRRVGPKRDI